MWAKGHKQKAYHRFCGHGRCYSGACYCTDTGGNIRQKRRGQLGFKAESSSAVASETDDTSEEDSVADESEDEPDDEEEESKDDKRKRALSSPIQGTTVGRTATRS